MKSDLVLLILEQTKEFVQAGRDVLAVDGDFVHAVEMDGELYMVSIEKYVPVDVRIKQAAELLEANYMERISKALR